MSFDPRSPVPKVSESALHSIYESFAKQAIQNLDEVGHVHPVMFLLSVEDGKTEPSNGMSVDPDSISMLMRSSQSKAVLANMMQAFIDASSPVHVGASTQLGAHVNLVVMIAETWLVKGAKDIERACTNGLSPSEHPDRKEAIMVNLYTSSGLVSGLCEITRDSSGKPSAAFTPLELGISISGAMVPGSTDNKRVMNDLIRDAGNVLRESASLDEDSSFADVERAVKRPGPRLH